MRRAAAAHVVVGDVGAGGPGPSADDAHHLGAVLRLRAGEIVTVTDGRGAWRVCRYGVGGSLEVDGEVQSDARPAPALTVGFAPVKGDRPEWAVQKLTELRIDRIVVLRTDRGVVRWDKARAASQRERLAKVARSALMQSRGCWLPEITGPVGVGELAAGAGGVIGGVSGGVALAGPGGGPPSLACPTVLVGPEGGWSPEEEALGLPVVGLGASVLRTETAAVAAGVLLAGLRAGLVAPAG